MAITQSFNVTWMRYRIYDALCYMSSKSSIGVYIFVYQRRETWEIFWYCMQVMKDLELRGSKWINDSLRHCTPLCDQEHITCFL